jgi:hypothetical protein
VSAWRCSCRPHPACMCIGRLTHGGAFVLCLVLLQSSASRWMCARRWWRRRGAACWPPSASCCCARRGRRLCCSCSRYAGGGKRSCAPSAACWLAGVQHVWGAAQPAKQPRLALMLTLFLKTQARPVLRERASGISLAALLLAAGLPKLHTGLRHPAPAGAERRIPSKPLRVCACQPSRGRRGAGASARQGPFRRRRRAAGQPAGRPGGGCGGG